ncbi:MAG: AAA family ATPase [Acidimicrobiia bacterium]|nr:AAA family ATPase [Acidimicrobiia bacterium]
MTSPRVLERDPLLQALGECLDEARQGRGTAVFVAGEAGIGKTTPVRAFLDRLDRSTNAAVGACDPLSTPRALSPLLDIAADPESGFASVVDMSADLHDVFDQVLRFLRFDDRPTVLVIEDVHWADQSTLDLIRFLGRRVRDSRSILVCTYRDDELAPDHPLRPVLGDLATSRVWVQRLQLEPLSVAAVWELAADHDADPALVHEVTGGNPFYVTEFLASGDQVPSTVRGAVMARVDRLDPDARRLAEVTSIAPRSLEIAHALDLARVDLAAAERTLHAGVLVGSGEALAFRHELARTAVESSMLPARRVGLHRRIITLLDTDHGRNLARLAHHAVQAGTDDLVQRYAPAAAAEAQARGAHRQAAELLAAAIAHPGVLTGDELAELRLRLAWELYVLNRPDAAAVVRAAVDHRRRGDDPVARARALSARARLDWNLDPATARATIEEAISLLENEPPGQPLDYAYYLAGHLNMLARRYEPAVRFGRKCIDVSRSLDLAREEENGLLALGTAELVAGDVDEGRAVCTPHRRTLARGRRSVARARLPLRGGSGARREWRGGRSAHRGAAPGRGWLPGRRPTGSAPRCGRSIWRMSPLGRERARLPPRRC